MLYVMEASEPVVAETEAADLSKKEAVGTDDSDQVDKSNEPDKEADDDLEDGEITDDDEEEDEAAAEQSHPAENEDKVWSLTQFYSVDFSQSRIGVKKGRSTNAQPGFVSAVFDSVL